MHNDFTLFPRKIPGGKTVFYYYAYNKEGQRWGPWTTKCQGKTAARNYCHGLLKKGALIPDRTKGITFAEYADGFWERNSEYVKRQESRRDITDSYINNCKVYVVCQMIPFFGNMPLDKITDKDVNKWLLSFRERKAVKDGKEVIVRYQNTYANTVFGHFNVMLAEAVRRGLIPSNPCEKVAKLKNDRKKIEILTVEEVQKMFPDDYRSIWGGKEPAYAANRLASLTGMRIGEVLGLRGEYVFDNFIRVCGQSETGGYKDYTKTKENRNIPLLPEMMALLQELMKKNGKGFLFSLDGGATSVCSNYIRVAFRKALNNIGITNAEIKRRALTVHGWRHFVNTDLLRQGLTVQQVQSVTGHKSVQMTDRYNHPDPRQIEAVVKAQAVIMGKQETPEKPKATAKSKKKAEGLQLVKVTA